MKKLDIIGENYYGTYLNHRIACRGIIVEDDKILLTYETIPDLYMIPGGGLEADENEKDCCIREIKEETGYIIEPEDSFLQIDEYYEDFRYINRYFCARITDSCQRDLTEQEQINGLEKRWLPLKEAIDIFSKHNDYKDIDEMKRGLYLREYTALCEYMKMVFDHL